MMAYEVAAIRRLKELANLRRRRISLTRRVGCWSPVPISEAVINTGDLQERRSGRAQQRAETALALTKGLRDRRLR